jgi:uncharacterized protein YecT (DUF1311 family)
MKRAYNHALAVYRPSPQKEKELKGLPTHDQEFARESDKRILRKLMESQRLWMAYRESACAVVEGKYGGGTITALVVPLCKKELTEQRTKWLKDNFGDKDEAGGPEEKPQQIVPPKK